MGGPAGRSPPVKMRSAELQLRVTKARALFLLFDENVGRFLGEPVEEVTGFPEAAVVRRRAEHDDRDLIALRQPQQRRQAVAGLRDEAGLPTHDVDIAAQ